MLFRSGDKRRVRKRPLYFGAVRSTGTPTLPKMAEGQGTVVVATGLHEAMSASSMMLDGCSPPAGRVQRSSRARPASTRGLLGGTPQARWRRGVRHPKEKMGASGTAPIQPVERIVGNADVDNGHCSFAPVRVTSIDLGEPASLYRT